MGCIILTSACVACIPNKYGLVTGGFCRGHTLPYAIFHVPHASSPHSLTLRHKRSLDRASCLAGRSFFLFNSLLAGRSNIQVPCTAP